MRVWVSTVIRHVDADERSGRLLLVDLAETARVVGEIRVPESAWRHHDPNPRGGTRGVRSVATLGDRVVAATYAAVHVFDADGEVLQTLEHPLLAYVHCVVPDERGLWVAATAADRIVRLDWSGAVISQWSAADSSLVTDAVDLVAADVLADYRDPRELAAHVHGVTQLNSIAVRGRTLWANLGMVLTHAAGGAARDFSGVRPPGWAPSATPVATSHLIVRLDIGPDDSLGGGMLCRRQQTSSWPNHDLWPGEDGLWFNDTDTGHLTRVGGGRVRVGGDFLRGLVGRPDGLALVGTQSPLRVHQVDLRQHRVRRSWDLDGSPEESITCLAEASP